MDVDETIAVTFQDLNLVLGEAVDYLPVSDPSQLLRFLPACSPEARRLMLAELIKLDMAKSNARGQVRRLDFYRGSVFDQYDNGLVPLDLVLEEIQIRRAHGEMPQLADLNGRYPHLNDVLAVVLNDVHTRVASTRVAETLVKAPHFGTGERVDDFTILRLLGHGGFANVYLARQNSMQRLVALKVSSTVSDEPIALGQFDHPNIVRVYDQRMITEPQAVLLYMQYVPGGTLSELVRASADLRPDQLSGKTVLEIVDRSLLEAGQQSPEHSPLRETLAVLNWPQAVAWIGIYLAEGLAAAHRLGIMHRDVKPANILMTGEGMPKLADFNVSFSSIAGCAGAAVYFGGSLAYMSPEQLQVVDRAGSRDPEDLDSRSDLYSLSMVLWELWQGARPARSTEIVSNWQAAVTHQLELRQLPPQRLRDADSAAARVLEKALRQTLSYDRETRPRSGDELAGRLRLALSEDAARLFEPSRNTLGSRISRLPVFVTTALIIFIPNGLAGGLNYQYNLNSILANYPQLETSFRWLSFFTNLIAFPVGAAVLVCLASLVQRSLGRVGRGQPVSEREYGGAWNLGHRAAMVGGMLWVIAGIIFPLVLMREEPNFAGVHAAEFFMSMAICGGIAWIYPFFGISLLATEIYYPALVAPSMIDSRFAQRAEQLKRRATVYLATAAAIPLTALALLGARRSAAAYDQTSVFLLVVVVLTAVALLFAFIAYQRLHKTIATLGKVL